MLLNFVEKKGELELKDPNFWSRKFISGKKKYVWIYRKMHEVQGDKLIEYTGDPFTV